MRNHNTMSMIAGGVLGAAVVGLAMADRHTKSKFKKSGKRIMTKAGRAIEDAADQIW